MSPIDESQVIVDIIWLSAADGGRLTGPPKANSYACTVIFLEMNGAPIDGEHHSAVFEFLDSKDGTGKARLWFLVPDNVRKLIEIRRKINLMEGPKIVANAQIISI